MATLLCVLKKACANTLSNNIAYFLFAFSHIFQRALFQCVRNVGGGEAPGHRGRRPGEEGGHAAEGQGAGGEDPGEEEGAAGQEAGVRLRVLHPEDAAPDAGVDLGHLGRRNQEVGGWVIVRHFSPFPDLGRPFAWCPDRLFLSSRSLFFPLASWDQCQPRQPRPEKGKERRERETETPIRVERSHAMSDGLSQSQKFLSRNGMLRAKGSRVVADI